jgi:hypothetical protein
MINITRGATNSFALTLTEQLDDSTPNFYYLFEFINSMTLENKLFTSSDISAYSDRYNLFTFTEGTPENPLTPKMSLREGSWVYSVYQMADVTPISYTASNAIKLLEVGKVWVSPSVAVDVPTWSPTMSTVENWV